MSATFEELLEAGDSADVTGWDFSWLQGRATEERPPWGYATLLSRHLRGASASLDLQTGGGEVLAPAETFPKTAVATESWLPNLARATARLHRRGVVVEVGPASAFELIEFLLGPQPDARHARDPEAEADDARAAGLEVVDLRRARLRIEIHDVGAVVYLLRKVIWWVPGFTVAHQRCRLEDLHDHIQTHGPFITHSTRHLIEARQPTITGENKS